MLETIHEYARERLEASGEAEAIIRRHALYFMELAERAEPEMKRAHQKYWFQLLDTELDNLRAVLEWSLGDGEILYGIRIGSVIGLYWSTYGRQDEGIRWTQRLLVRLNEVPNLDQARFLRSVTYLISYRDQEAGIQLGYQAVAMARAVGDKTQLSMALAKLTAVLISRPEIEPLAQEAVNLCQELDDQPGLAWMFNVIGEHARISGDDERSKQAYEEALAIAEQRGDTRLQYTVLYNLAFVAQHEGNHQQAIRLLRRSITICREMGIPTTAVAVLILAGSLGAAGEPERAARLFGAAQAFLQRTGSLVHPDDHPEHEHNMALARAQLDDDTWKTLLAEGHRITLEEAIEEILKE
jgi:tetratricopeptide (TPR) repeat protein